MAFSTRLLFKFKNMIQILQQTNRRYRYLTNTYLYITSFIVYPYLIAFESQVLIGNHIIMSGEEYTRKIEECRRQLGALKKDIQYRDEQVARNEPTFALDAEIRGQFVQIDEQLGVLKVMLQNFEGKSKDLNLMPRQLQKRRNAFQTNVDQRNKLIRMYDESLARRVPNSLAAKTADDMDRFKTEYKKPMDKEQLLALKQKQEKAQDDAIDDLLGAVKQMKAGNVEIKEQLVVQDGLLNNLQAGMDQNTQKMSKVRRNLGKLLQSSSYTCLVLVILLQIAGIVCNLIFWKKA